MANMDLAELSLTRHLFLHISLLKLWKAFGDVHQTDLCQWEAYQENIKYLQ